MKRLLIMLSEKEEDILTELLAKIVEEETKDYEVAYQLLKKIQNKNAI